MSDVWGTVYQLERDRATGNDPASLRAEIERLQAEHDEYVIRANANVCELNREIEQLRKDATRYRYLREGCFYYFGESFSEPSPREFGIAWQWQDNSPARPSPEEVLDADVAAWLKEQEDADSEKPAA